MKRPTKKNERSPSDTDMKETPEVKRPMLAEHSPSTAGAGLADTLFSPDNLQSEPGCLGPSPVSLDYRFHSGRKRLRRGRRGQTDGVHPWEAERRCTAPIISIPIEGRVCPPCFDRVGTHQGDLTTMVAQAEVTSRTLLRTGRCCGSQGLYLLESCRQLPRKRTQLTKRRVVKTGIDRNPLRRWGQVRTLG